MGGGGGYYWFPGFRPPEEAQKRCQGSPCSEQGRGTSESFPPMCHSDL